MAISLIDEVWLWFTNPDIMHTYGYLGIFGVSLVGSLVIFVPMPYFFLVVWASVNPSFDPTLIGLVSAIGAASAKMMVFEASYAGSSLMGEESKGRMKPFMKLVSRYGGVAAFLAAATPIPDDLVYIPLGLAKYSRLRFILATFSGKILFTMLVVWGSHLSFNYVRFLIQEASDPTGAVLLASIIVAATAATVYLITRLDWAKVLGRWFPWTLEP